MLGSLDMAKHRPQWRRIKMHRSYSVEQAAETLKVTTSTVRRWLKTGLPHLIDQKPTLILGRELKTFGASRKGKKQKCLAHECYCFRCRAPRSPALCMADYVPISPTGGNLRAICGECETIMHKRIGKAALKPLGAILDISICQASADLIESAKPCPNDHLQEESRP
jgi:Homeodomain-like domain